MPDILVTNSLSKSFGGIRAVDNCSISVEKKSLTGLIGPNGSGKTTLFNLISGLLRANSGMIIFEGDRIDGIAPNRIAMKGIGRIYQLSRIFNDMTVLENLVVIPCSARKRETREKARDLLKIVDLLRFEKYKAGSLSYGQQRLLEFMRVMMLDPKLMLLDEPFAGVNPILQEKLVDIIFKVNREKGTTIFLIEHSIKIIMRLCQRILVMHQGKLFAQGSPEEIRNNSEIIDAYFGKRSDARR